MTATMVAGQRPKPSDHPVVLKADRMVDVDERTIVEPGVVVVQGERIRDVSPERIPDDAQVIELGDVTLLPGLMDMELNFLMGGAGGTLMSSVQDDPAMKLMRAIPSVRKTLLAGFTTVRNLGLFVQTGGLLLDVTLMKAVDAGWIPGPRIFPSGHAITPSGGHLDPTMFQGFAPGVLPLTVDEGIADGVSQVRRAVRYQIKYGATQIKVCASGGVMSLTGTAGAQHYSDEELRAIVDEAHRRGMRVAAHAHGDQGIRAAIEAGIDCIEHASLMSEETQELALQRGEGGRGLPDRQEDDRAPDRRGSEDRHRHRCSRRPARAELEGAVGAGATRDATGRRDRGVDGDERRSRAAGGRPRSVGAGVPGRHHRGARRPDRGHHRHRARAVRDEGWRGVQGARHLVEIQRRRGRMAGTPERNRPR
jgi:imidazolonepropionase-like amidohydrolase